MVQVAVAGDATEAEELQELLRNAGIVTQSRGRLVPKTARDLIVND